MLVHYPLYGYKTSNTHYNVMSHFLTYCVRESVCGKALSIPVDLCTCV